jgi:hypothetical protein
MPGVHRRPDGGSAGKSARFLAVLAGLVIGAAAVVAGVIWFFATGTDLKLSAVLLILATAGLVRALAQGKLDMVWVSMSVVVSSGWQVISDVTHQPRWSLTGYVVWAAALACAVIGVIPTTRAGRLGQIWQGIRARLASGPGGGGPARPG